MPPKTVLQVVGLSVVAAFFAFSAIKGHSPESVSEWLAPVGPGVTAAGIGLWVFDRWVWRWPLVCKIVGRPVLHGTWHGELASDWVDPNTSQRIPADPDVFLVVRQRYWQVIVRLLTRESSSVSRLADFRRDPDGVHQLIYVYANFPRPDVRDRSAQHYGAVVLNAPHDRQQGLEGEYFTGRSTKGEMRFRHHVGNPVDTHAAARKLLDGQPRRGLRSRLRRRPTEG